MATEVMKDIFRLEVPLPKSPLKALNSYLIRGKDRSLLIDTGFNRPECGEALRKELEALNVRMEETDIYLTHLHSDHTGLAPYYSSDKNTGMDASTPPGIFITPVARLVAYTNSNTTIIAASPLREPILMIRV